MSTRTILVFAAAALLCAGCAAGASSGTANPAYTSAALVNSADNVAGPLAPNTIATLYGTNLSFYTAALNSSEIQNALLPTELPLSGVHVYVGRIMASIYYVSSTQINFLIPAEIPPQTTTFQVVRAGAAGPLLPVTLSALSPGFYMLDSERVVAQHLDGSIITTEHPAHPGEIVILYGTGLGQTIPALRNGEVPTQAQPIASALTIVLDGKPVPAPNLLYAGTAPTFSGLYQINLKLPGDAGTDPQIQMGLGTQMSPRNVRLIVRPAP